MKETAETHKDEFCHKHLYLTHDQPITFITCRWQPKSKPNIIYLIYRWVVALTFLVTLGILVINFDQLTSLWLIYLENWNYILCTLETSLAAVALSCCIVAPKLQESVLKFYKFYWVLHIIASDMAIVIPILYWSITYDENIQLDAMNSLVHIVNPVIMLVDLFMVAHPTHLIHMCYSVLFGFCYALFSGIYYAAGGTSKNDQIYIYSLDWSNPVAATFICVGVLFQIGFVHTICWLVHQVTEWLSKIVRTTSDKPMAPRRSDCSVESATGSENSFATTGTATSAADFYSSTEDIYSTPA